MTKPAAHPTETESTPEDVVTTVWELGEVSIRLSVVDDLHLFIVRGPYDPSVARELEKLARRCRGNIGLQFFDDRTRRPGAPPLVFDASVLRLLSSLHSQCQKRGLSFFLCDPPPKLEDLLALSGVTGRYATVSRSGLRSGAEASKSGSRRVPATPQAGSASGSHVLSERSARARPSAAPKNRPAAEAGRRLYQLNTSLKRTADLEKGLESAARCVERILPAKPPCAEGYDFAFIYRSSEKVGGDFFDFIPLDDRNLGIVIGDVSGHGLDAALIMCLSKKVLTLRALDLHPASPSEVLCRVNADLTPDLARRMFVTALYGVLDLATGEFCFARAGHESPIVFGSESPRFVQSGGVALGLGIPKYFDQQIRDEKVQLGAGDCVLLVTDGLAECRNEKEATYSRERLLFDCSQVETTQPARSILEGILSPVEAFAGKRPQEDDMTAVLVQRFLGTGRSA